MTDCTDIAKLRGLLERATPGPLVFTPQTQAMHRGKHWGGILSRQVEGGPLHLVVTGDAGLLESMVSVVNALPALLDELERLRRVEVAAQRFNPARLGCICHLTSVPPCAACELRAALPASAIGGEG